MTAIIGQAKFSSVCVHYKKVRKFASFWGEFIRCKSDSILTSKGLLTFLKLLEKEKVKFVLNDPTKQDIQGQ